MAEKIEGVINPWVPMNNPYDLALIAKLGEEASELAKACARATMQGLDGTSPEQEGRTNAEEIAREYMDVKAVMSAMDCRRIMDNPADNPELEWRHDIKVSGFLRWMDLLKTELINRGNKRA